MNTKKLAYFIFGLSVLIFLFSVLNFIFGQRVLQTGAIYTSVNISDRGGIYVNKTALVFGEVLLGGSSTKSIIIENGFPFAVVAEISCEGDICKILEFDRVVKLEKEENKKTPFLVVTDTNTKRGFYEGSIKVQLKRKTTLL